MNYCQMRYATAFFLFAVSAFSLTAGSLKQDLVVYKNGAIKIGQVKASIVHYTKKWKQSEQSSPGNTIEKTDKKAGSRIVCTGEFPAGDKKFNLKEDIKFTGNNSFTYQAEVNNKTGIETGSLSLLLKLKAANFAGKTLLINGKAVVLPEVKGKSHAIFSGAKNKTLIVPLGRDLLFIKTDCYVVVQDNRIFGSDVFQIRLHFTPWNNVITKADLKVEFILKQVKCTPIDIKAQANMGFKDEVKNDKKGGWTDQGPDNDLSEMVPGKYVFSGIDFQIADPKKNKGKGCIVLAGPTKDFLPKSVTIPVKTTQAMPYLYVLHTAAWAPKKETVIGQITAVYRDGTESANNVVIQRDLADWWNPVPLKNGAVPMSFQNSTTYVGLYLSRYKFENKPIKYFKIDANQKAVWMIVGMSVANEDIPLPANLPLLISESREWQPMQFVKDIKTGSVMDFSGMFLDAPAGKYGFIKAVGDKFEFEKKPGDAVRFYGTNLCWKAVCMEKKVCDTVVDRIWKSGYNSVRLHHFDNFIIDRSKGKNTELDAKAMDQVDYLFYSLKKLGIYTTIDLFISRQHLKGDLEGINVKLNHHEYKPLVFIYEPAYQSWEKFSENFLNHVNPYTKLAWKEDPALISISLVNEDTIFSSRFLRNEVVRKIMEEKFSEWCGKKGITPDLDLNAFKNPDYRHFLTERYNITYARMIKFLQKLGVKYPISDQNMMEHVALAQMRKQYDYVDNHFYFDHPRFLGKAWQLPSSLGNRSSLTDYVSKIGRYFAARLADKPHMITEFDYPSPNMYRAEASTVLGAYAALNSWDGLYRFDFASEIDHYTLDEKKNYRSFFSSSIDPLKTISEKIGVLMFLRSDVKPSKNYFPVLITEKYADNPENPTHYPASARRLGLISASGTVILNDEMEGIFPKGTNALLGIEKKVGEKKWDLPYFKLTNDMGCIKKMVTDGVIDKKCANIAKGVFRSDTGQIELEGKAGRFRVVTEKSETFVLHNPDTVTGRNVTVKGDKKYAVLSVMSVDGLDLPESKRMLILHLTDVQRSNTRFGNKVGTILEKWGTLPYLARCGSATINIKHNDLTGYKLFAVDTGGNRLFEMPYKKISKKEISINVNTSIKSKVVMAYELVAE